MKTKAFCKNWIRMCYIFCFDVLLESIALWLEKYTVFLFIYLIFVIIQNK